MFKIAYINDLSETAKKLFTKDKYEETTLENAQAVMIRSTDIHFLTLPKSVVAVARSGIGVNTIPVKRFGEEGVVVFNTPGGNSNAVKEMTIACLILAKRDLIKAMSFVNSIKDDKDIIERVEKEKAPFSGKEIYGKRLGVIGLGAIGGMVAIEAYNLGMQVFGYDPFISVEHAWGLPKNIKNCTRIQEIFEKCEYITIHAPLKEDTLNMIDEEAFSLMQKGTVLINFARGAIVNNKALRRALEDKTVYRYVTDFPDSEVVNMPNTIITPHIGGSTSESEANCAIMAVNEIKEYLEMGNIRNSVNYPNCNASEISGKVRIAINHKNIPNMLAQFTSFFGNNSINISRLVNNSREDLAYTIIDINDEITEKVLSELNCIDGVIRVRVIQKN